MAYIYKITNLINNKIYIGKTLQTIEKRFKEHCKDYLKREEEKRPLYSAMKKYGINNFKIEQVEECDENLIDERERYWIEYYDSFKNGYNATLGGDGKAYVNRQLVINTYNETQNCAKTAELCKIHITTVYKILEENNIQRKSSQQIAKETLSKAIFMLNLQNEKLLSFESMTEAAQYLKDNNKAKGDIKGIRSHIRDVCKGKRQTAYGYKWKWLDISG